MKNGWKVKVYNSFEEIESIRGIWNKLQFNSVNPSPEADIERFLARLEPIKDTSKPYVVVAYLDGQPESMLVARLGSTRLRCSIGHITLLRPSVRTIRIDYGGILGNTGEKACSKLFEVLYKSLKESKADIAVFNYLPLHSQMYTLLARNANVLNRGHFSKKYEHWQMIIPPDMDTFYKKLSKKHRGNLRRQIRKLEEKHKVEVVTYTGEDQLEQALANANKVFKKTYQYSLSAGGGFLDDEHKRSMLESSAKNGWMRMHILFINAQPCAFQLGLQYGKIYLLEKVGYDPAWRKLSIGSTLFLKVLEGLCSDPEVEKMDFGFGGEGYKKSYGDESWDEMVFYLFAPRLYPVYVNLIHTMISAVRICISSAADKLGFQKQLKRWWRRYLTKKH
jgi:hypothetical protein